MEDNKKLDAIQKKLESISLQMEAMKLSEYVDMMKNPRRMLWSNFVGGLARGFGMGIGFTLLGAVALYILQRIVVLNIPFIGQFIAEIVRIVQNTINLRP